MVVLNYARTKIKSLYFKFSPILKFEIKEESMKPLINPGDLVLVERISFFFRDPKISDLVIFQISKDKFYIKKITAKKGGEYFMGGENKRESIDSRHFGWIKSSAIIGRVFYIYKSN